MGWRKAVGDLTKLIGKVEALRISILDQENDRNDEASGCLLFASEASMFMSKARAELSHCETVLRIL